MKTPRLLQLEFRTKQTYNFQIFQWATSVIVGRECGSEKNSEIININFCYKMHGCSLQDLPL